MIKHLGYYIAFIILPCCNAYAQDIITADGQSMGPKSIFMEVCTENMSGNMPDLKTTYNVVDFCNCMADELLPTYTKKQINYYFTQGHMDEMFLDSTSNQIIINCLSKNMNNNSSLPPPEELIKE